MLLDILLAVIILVCAALVGVILLQRSEGGVLGTSSGSNAFMTARGTGDLLTTTTQILAGLFFTLCLVMTIISGRQHAASSVADRLKLSINPNSISSAPAAPSPASAAPAAPAPAPAPMTVPGGNPLNLFGSAGAPARPAPVLRPAPIAPLAPQLSTSAALAAKPATPSAAPTPASAAAKKPKPAKPAPAASPSAGAPPSPAVSAPAPIVAPPPAPAPAPAPATPAAPAGQ